MKKQTKNKVTELLKRAVDIQKQLDAVKKLYGEMDEITTQLVEGGFEMSELEQHKIMLVDNFKTKNTVFKVAGVKRFELKIEEK